jgi:hypothetical protein
MLLINAQPQRHRRMSSTALAGCTAKSNGQNIDKGSYIMKIRKAEFLLAVAIVTSAAVMQIREYLLKAPQQNTTQRLSCDAPHQGLVPAACATLRSERPVDGTQRTPQPAARIWV